MLTNQWGSLSTFHRDSQSELYAIASLACDKSAKAITFGDGWTYKGYKN